MKQVTSICLSDSDKDTAELYAGMEGCSRSEYIRRAIVQRNSMHQESRKICTADRFSHEEAEGIVRARLRDAAHIRIALEAHQSGESGLILGRIIDICGVRGLAVQVKLREVVDALTKAGVARVNYMTGRIVWSAEK